MSGIDLIRAERQRQIDSEGWTAEHDDGHAEGELALAAATYAIPHEGRQARIWMENAAGTSLTRRFLRQMTWPVGWGDAWFKPTLLSVASGFPTLEAQTHEGRIRELVKAGALIAAEIDRLHRATGAKT